MLFNESSADQGLGKRWSTWNFGKKGFVKWWSKVFRRNHNHSNKIEEPTSFDWYLINHWKYFQCQSLVVNKVNHYL